MSYRLIKCGLSLHLLLFLLGCSPEPPVAKLAVKTHYSRVDLNCNSLFMHGNKKWAYRQLQFFLSEVSVKNANEQWQPLTLIDSRYQSNNVALIGESCNDSNQAENANWQLQFDGAVDFTQISAIKFTLGVPFELNHLNPLKQSSPLNDPSMFWVWQTGHKFLRLEMLGYQDNWLFHLGSTGCSAPSAVRSPKKQCLHPNRIMIELAIEKSDSTRGVIALDLAKLLSGLKLTDENSCQSDQTNPNCQQLFKNIGLNTTEEKQGVFSYE